MDPFVKIDDRPCDPTIVRSIAENIVSLKTPEKSDFSVFDIYNNFKSVLS